MIHNPKGVTERDKIIGKKIRELRTAKLVNLHDLAIAIKVSFQQLQKYEQGINRIPASRLWNIADFLDININEFQPGVDKLTPILIKNQRLIIRLSDNLKTINNKEYVKLLVRQTEVIMEIINIQHG